MSIHVADRSRSSRRLPAAAPPARFDLSLSENPFPPLPSVREAIQLELGRANRYPEFLPARLPGLIADHLGVHPDQVVVGSGATGVAMQILHTLAGPSAEMVLGVPTFDGYPIMAAMTGADLIGIPLDSAGDQDLRTMARAVGDRTRLVVLCRPHNPTGTLVSKRDLHRFLRAIPARIPVILDEAYVEFLPTDDRIAPHALLARHPNLLLLRTFSKAYGLAGLRIGYALGNPALITRIRRHQLPFGTPTLAVTAVRASYAAEPELAVRVARIIEERDSLRAALRDIGIDAPPSYANFLYLPGPGVATALRRAGITAKAYPDGSARIAVGDIDAGHAVIDALRAAAAGQGADVRIT
ncbi:pyridoxal phosphate-dependent aminotransferase [Nocardia cyriacigeorgica]|uniref:pyridoxal phosphate-dependent aminotransferase n=1 Tax=Nocardia cyriacigeorgica TaxID=135487 RepID=UPI002453D3A9|nr:aminotransferase class I/II-fold pyridoxal phosphate-dependent enzyme [Nocardia cyriacigeorgica]